MGLEQITRRESLRLIGYVAAISSGVGGVILTAAHYLTPPGLSGGPLTDAEFDLARLHEDLRNEFCALLAQQLKAEGRLSYSTGLVYDPDYDKTLAYA
ncbi:hypothetical protein HY497_00205, partial [Candidatus Woesearchaeota archaeon]|nr:hypothetical protein [Candidatus Woesearchaeota archaeon]